MCHREGGRPISSTEQHRGQNTRTDTKRINNVLGKEADLRRAQSNLQGKKETVSAIASAPQKKWDVSSFKSLEIQGSKSNL